MPCQPQQGVLDMSKSTDVTAAYLWQNVVCIQSDPKALWQAERQPTPAFHRPDSAPDVDYQPEHQFAWQTFQPIILMNRTLRHSGSNHLDAWPVCLKHSRVVCRWITWPRGYLPVLLIDSGVDIMMGWINLQQIAHSLIMLFYGLSSDLKPHTQWYRKCVLIVWYFDFWLLWTWLVFI